MSSKRAIMFSKWTDRNGPCRFQVRRGIVSTHSRIFPQFERMDPNLRFFCLFRSKRIQATPRSADVMPHTCASTLLSSAILIEQYLGALQTLFLYSFVSSILSVKVPVETGFTMHPTSYLFISFFAIFENRTPIKWGPKTESIEERCQVNASPRSQL